jgi:hypothetical protein
MALANSGRKFSHLWFNLVSVDKYLCDRQIPMGFFEVVGDD